MPDAMNVAALTVTLGGDIGPLVKAFGAAEQEGVKSGRKAGEAFGGAATQGMERFSAAEKKAINEARERSEKYRTAATGLTQSLLGVGQALGSVANARDRVEAVGSAIGAVGAALPAMAATFGVAFGPVGAIVSGLAVGISGVVTLIKTFGMESEEAAKKAAESNEKVAATLRRIWDLQRDIQAGKGGATPFVVAALETERAAQVRVQRAEEGAQMVRGRGGTETWKIAAADVELDAAKRALAEATLERARAERQAAQEPMGPDFSGELRAEAKERDKQKLTEAKERDKQLTEALRERILGLRIAKAQEEYASRYQREVADALYAGLHSVREWAKSMDRSRDALDESIKAEQEATARAKAIGDQNDFWNRRNANRSGDQERLLQVQRRAVASESALNPDMAMNDDGTLTAAPSGVMGAVMGYGQRLAGMGAQAGGMLAEHMPSGLSTVVSATAQGGPEMGLLALALQSKGAATAVEKFSTLFQKLADVFSPLFEPIGKLFDALSPLVDIIAMVVTPVFEAIGYVLNPLLDGLKALFEWIKSTMQTEAKKNGEGMAEMGSSIETVTRSLDRMNDSMLNLPSGYKGLAHARYASTDTEGAGGGFSLAGHASRGGWVVNGDVNVYGTNMDEALDEVERESRKRGIQQSGNPSRGAPRYSAAYAGAGA